MSGILTAAGIVGGILFSVGFSSASDDPVASRLTIAGLVVLGVAAVGGLIRLFA